MGPSFYFQVVPKIPRRLRKYYYAIAAGHSVLGVVAEMLRIYIVLAAGIDAMPQRFRLKNYRAWMRTTFVLWWLVLLFGAATYLRLCVRR